jgi:hypothetical protein
MNVLSRSESSTTYNMGGGDHMGKSHLIWTRFHAKNRGFSEDRGESSPPLGTLLRLKRRLEPR